MSKYIKLYQLMCPLDEVTKDDPRRAAIIAEMRYITNPKRSIEDAANYIRCWGGWSEKDSPEEFVKRARERYASIKNESRERSA
ncbi:MAG: hypothetical protein QXS54_03000 [Candidatus Methanomethylicaceae archaeon]